MFEQLDRQAQKHKRLVKRMVLVVDIFEVETSSLLLLQVIIRTHRRCARSRNEHGTMAIGGPPGITQVALPQPQMANMMANHEQNMQTDSTFFLYPR